MEAESFPLRFLVLMMKVLRRELLENGKPGEGDSGSGSILDQSSRCITFFAVLLPTGYYNNGRGTGTLVLFCTSFLDIVICLASLEGLIRILRSCTLLQFYFVYRLVYTKLTFSK